MVEINLNIAHPEKNESANEALDDEEAEVLDGHSIGDEVDGETLGFDGGRFEITGGSDRAGFPMRADTPGIGRKEVLIKGGTGLRQNRKGRRVRRTVSGNTIYEETAQVNLKVLEDGSGLFEDDEDGAETDEDGESSDESEDNADEE
jgi:small subunit ribosomal protein S6e